MIVRLFLLFVCSSHFLFAQTNILDKEKLLDYYQTQKYAEAGRYLASVYPTNTANYAGLSQIAYCYMMSSKLVEAEQLYRRMDSIQPKTLSVLFNLAHINAKRGNRLRAYEYYSKIVALDSTNFNAYKNLAGLVDSGEMVIKYLKKANQLNPVDADVAFDLAERYAAGKNHLLALTVLQTAAKADTGNYILQKALMPIGNELKRYPYVIAIGEYLSKNASLTGNAIKDLGKAYFFNKSYLKAINTFQLLEKMDMQTEVTLYYTTLCYREIKDYTQAITYAKKVLDEAISPNATLYYNLLAGIYERNQKNALAVAAYKRGLTFGKNSSTYYQLALLYDTKMNQPKNALPYYKLYANSKDLDETDESQLNYTKARILAIQGSKASQATQK